MRQRKQDWRIGASLGGVTLRSASEDTGNVQTTKWTVSCNVCGHEYLLTGKGIDYRIRSYSRGCSKCRGNGPKTVDMNEEERTAYIRELMKKLKPTVVPEINRWHGII